MFNLKFKVNEEIEIKDFLSKNKLNILKVSLISITIPPFWFVGR